MDIEIYFKKVYTVAFRLTGNEKTACELTTNAILNTANELDLNYVVTSHIFKITILEVFKIFLENNPKCCTRDNTVIHKKKQKNKTLILHKALLNLEPFNRALVIWKDTLNFELSDLITININKNELKNELSSSYRQLKDYLTKNHS